MPTVTHLTIAKIGTSSNVRPIDAPGDTEPGTVRAVPTYTNDSVVITGGRTTHGAPFMRLHHLAIGDRIDVTHDDGSIRFYRVFDPAGGRAAHLTLNATDNAATTSLAWASGGQPGLLTLIAASQHDGRPGGISHRIVVHALAVPEHCNTDQATVEATDDDGAMTINFACGHHIDLGCGEHSLRVLAAIAAEHLQRPCPQPDEPAPPAWGGAITADHDTVILTIAGTNRDVTGHTVTALAALAGTPISVECDGILGVNDDGDITLSFPCGSTRGLEPNTDIKRLCDTVTRHTDTNHPTGDLPS